MCDCDLVGDDQEPQKEKELSANCKYCISMGVAILVFTVLTLTAYFSYQKGLEHHKNNKITITYNVF